LKSKNGKKKAGRGYGEKRCRDLIRAGLEVFGISAKDLKTEVDPEIRTSG